MTLPCQTLAEPGRGNYTSTRQGINFYPFDPKAIEIDLLDIATGLSNACRFAGQCGRFYSVAEHSVLVAMQLTHESVETQLWGLLHDAAEAYIGDMARPIKIMFPEFSVMENGILRQVAQRFDLSWPIPQAVKDIDGRIMADEALQLWDRPPAWTRQYVPVGVGRLRCDTPSNARALFLDRFAALIEERSEL